MTGAGITFDDKDARLALSKLEQRVANLRPALKVIGVGLENKVRQTFASGKDPWGSPWDALADSTVSKRRKGSDVPLRDTGRLMNSITHALSKNSVSIGTNVVYADTHQYGAAKGEYGTKTVTQTVKKHTRRTKSGKKTTVRKHTRQATITTPWGDVPARRFLPVHSVTGQIDLPPSWKQHILDAVTDHLGATA
jgi:phage virion morphogenesis protein